MVEIFGNYLENFESMEYLVISLRSNKFKIGERWKSCDISADFLAEYWGTFYPVHTNSSRNDVNDVKDAVNFIANELFENALKFDAKDSKLPIKLALCIFENELKFYITNAISEYGIKSFQELIKQLLTQDTQSLYFKRLEENAENGDNKESGLGLLTIINDYQCQMAWKFETNFENSGTNLVTTMVTLSIVRTE
ncbi:MAG: ATP-binding protein [Desulfobacterales bacterium]|nr:ATP-binding protein [Desulfobacterales bacterium]